MDLSVQLSRMAADADLQMLSYLLEVVKVEANRVTKPTRVGAHPKKTRGKRPLRSASGG